MDCNESLTPCRYEYSIFSVVIDRLGGKNSVRHHSPFGFGSFKAKISV